MGGKRPDQYQIDSNEGRTTDHKFNPQSTHGQTKDQPNLREGDKQRLAESRSGGQPFMPDVPAPSAEANRAAQAERHSDDEETGKENPLA